MTSDNALFSKLFPAIPFILVNTITVIPYLIFFTIHVDQSDLESFLPFILFYTIRMAGIFLLKSFQLGTGTFRLLKYSLISGMIGSIFGILGEWWYLCYFLSAILLGLSAAWLPPTNTTIKYQRKELNVIQKEISFQDLFFLLLLLLLFTGTLLIDFSAKQLLIFSEYALLYLAAFYRMRSYPVTDQQVKKID